MTRLCPECKGIVFDEKDAMCPWCGATIACERGVSVMIPSRTNTQDLTEETQVEGDFKHLVLPAKDLPDDHR